MCMSWTDRHTFKLTYFSFFLSRTLTVVNPCILDSHETGNTSPDLFQVRSKFAQVREYVCSSKHTIYAFLSHLHSYFRRLTRRAYAYGESPSVRFFSQERH